MLSNDRNTFVDGSWVLAKLEDPALCDSFDCGNSDLNEYFREDARQYTVELLTQTYCLRHSAYASIILALMDFCNDAVHIDQYRGVIRIHRSKQHRHLPAVKLTRFGVQKELQRKEIGTHALNMAKKFFTNDNRTGCRLLTVDAYNKPRVLDFYQRNGFNAFTDKDKKADTRALYFDLKRLVRTASNSLTISSTAHT